MGGGLAAGERKTSWVIERRRKRKREQLGGWVSVWLVERGGEERVEGTYSW